MPLELPREWGGARLHVQETLNRHNLILIGDGNGTKGLLTQFQTFLADHAAREDEQEKRQNRRHRSNTLLLALIAVLVAIGTAIISAIGIYVVHKDSTGGRSILTSSSQGEYARNSPNEAAVPYLNSR